jgi:caspase domain-containing protein
LPEQTTYSRQKDENGGKRKALIIAISDYDNLPPTKQLSFCRNDGQAVYETLLKQGYDIPSDFKLIGRVEGKRIKKTIINFFKKARATDTLVLYFSGHGMPDGHGNYFIASSDIDRETPQLDGYPFYELENERERSKAKKVITILDCCFSGAAGTEISMGDANDIAHVARDKMNKEFKEGEGKCLIASSLGDQLSYKMKDYDYSIFSYYLVEGLKGAGGKSIDYNGYVTVSTLSDYLFDEVTENGRQEPITKIAMSGTITLAYHPELKDKHEIITKLSANIDDSIKRHTLSAEEEKTIVSIVQAPTRRLVQGDLVSIPIPSIKLKKLISKHGLEMNYNEAIRLLKRCFYDADRYYAVTPLLPSRYNETMGDFLEKRNKSLVERKMLDRDVRIVVANNKDLMEDFGNRPSEFKKFARSHQESHPPAMLLQVDADIAEEIGKRYCLSTDSVGIWIGYYAVNLKTVYFFTRESPRFNRISATLYLKKYNSKGYINLVKYFNALVDSSNRIMVKGSKLFIAPLGISEKEKCMIHDENQW